MYDTPITHLHRTAFIIAIDCSTSMQMRIKFNHLQMSKADAVAIVCNYILDELLARATRNDKVRNYYDIGVVQYSGDGIVDILPDAIDGLTPIDILAKYQPPQKLYCFLTDPECEEYMTTIKYHIGEWITPTAHGRTPMYEALHHVYDIVEKWCARPENCESFPPIIFHITDGCYSDGSMDDILTISDRIKSLGTANGNVLFVNIHLSTDQSPTYTLFPPDREFTSPDRFKLMLFNMSSIMPKSMEPLIREAPNTKYVGPYRGVAFNSSICELMMVLNIGSQSIFCNL